MMGKGGTPPPHTFSPKVFHSRELQAMFWFIVRKVLHSGGLQVKYSIHAG
jgi:hypothetical protein